MLLSVIKLFHIILGVVALILTFASGVIWSFRGRFHKAKYTDIETLIAGAVWSQSIIPVGLVISHLCDVRINFYIYGYFAACRVFMLLVAGLSVLIMESLIVCKKLRALNEKGVNIEEVQLRLGKMHAIHFSIGTMLVAAGIIALTNFCLAFKIREEGYINLFHDII